ncbi:hypothetical protein QQF64_033408 [Cirrhinus molitorella]|uniref:Uncharacterized protein n=1 Tax=Cirrhinus molitorella TaxID=172907 RepID=A0ABR3MU18_9TELE
MFEVWESHFGHNGGYLKALGNKTEVRVGGGREGFLPFLFCLSNLKPSLSLATFAAPLASGHFLGGISGSGYFIRQSPKGYLFSRELLRSIQLPAASAGLSHPAVHLTATAKVMSPSLPFQD